MIRLPSANHLLDALALLCVGELRGKLGLAQLGVEQGEQVAPAGDLAMGGEAICMRLCILH